MHRVALLALSFASILAAQSMPAIEYRLRFPAPENHYVEVEATYPTEGLDEAVLMMATWTPGSYLMREYSGRVTRIESERPLEKVRKNRWHVETGGAPTVTVRYEVFCADMSVRTNWVERDLAILVGAATFITRIDPETDLPVETEHRVTLELPAGWNDSASGMAEPEPNIFIAADFDELVDSPILAGKLSTYPFKVEGKPHALVNQNEAGVWDGQRSAADVQTLTEAEIAFWGLAPYPRYLFLNAITEGGGGLEHKTSTLMMARRFATHRRKSYVSWLRLVSHEFFHTWNGKRLRPKALGPFNYERENYTPSLWVVEGLTSYYENILLARAELIDQKEFLEAMSGDIQAVQSRPGRLVQAASESSFDAWVKLYRRNPNTNNDEVSYYSSGSVIAWLLDVQIRQATSDRRTLDDALRLAYERYSGETGYTEAEFRALLSETAGKDLGPWLQQAVDEPGEFDYQPALDWFGLRFKPAKESEENDETSAWLGVSASAQNGRLRITKVQRGGPGYDAGLIEEDEILAINGFRVPPDGLADRLKQYDPGDELRILIARREAVQEIVVRAGAEPTDTWALEVDPEATPAQKERLAAWLAGPPPEREEER